MFSLVSIVVRVSFTYYGMASPHESTECLFCSTKAQELCGTRFSVLWKLDFDGPVFPLTEAKWTNTILKRLLKYLHSKIAQWRHRTGTRSNIYKILLKRNTSSFCTRKTNQHQQPEGNFTNFKLYPLYNMCNATLIMRYKKILCSWG